MRLFGRKPSDELPPLPRASRPGALPADGPATVGGVALPSGRRDGPLWRTGAEAREQFVPLARAFGETGLWPVLLCTDLPAFGPIDPEWPLKVDVDLPAQLPQRWFELGAYDAARRERLGSFPGVADGGPRQLEGLEYALSQVEEVIALALVPVTRPADVPAAIGWGGAGPVPAAVDAVPFLRSWEERFDALLISVAPDTFELAVRRPPLRGEPVRTFAAEAYLFCPDGDEPDDLGYDDRHWFFCWESDDEY